MDASGEGRRPRGARRGMRVAGLLVTAAALVAAAVPASARTPADPPSRPVVVVDCFSKAQVRPEEYLLACGDGNNRLVDLRWKSWGPHKATATGTDMVNDCRPNCAAGRFHPYPVTVTLSAPQTWPATPDLRRFTTIRLLYTHAAPEPVAKDVTYPLVY
ncbi:hypothetical protein ACGFXC_04300 [Streptomyces sp. NPDC048507]|uniref:hypothetical protein n=1 Tax=Streptomyces sp. NPDC048507 TaxID=3365560 RepID=UPI00371CA42B